MSTWTGPWAAPFSSPQAARAHTVAMLPACDREAFLASLEEAADQEPEAGG